MAVLEALLGRGDSSASAGDRVRQGIEQLARRSGVPVGLAAAEAFLVERCAPGHFRNMDELFGRMLGEPGAAPTVIR